VVNVINTLLSNIRIKWIDYNLDKYICYKGYEMANPTVSFDIITFIGILTSVGSVIGSYMMLKSDVKGLKNRLDSVEETIDDINSGIEKNIDEKIKKYDEKLELKEDMIAKRVDSIEKKIEETDRKLDKEINVKVDGLKEDLGSKTKLLFEKYDKLKLDVEEVQRSIAKLELRMSSSENILKDMEKLKDINIEIALNKKGIDVLEREMNRLENRIDILERSK
jgi:predicted  nucleic acid-binding Zn-ribbon protein